MVQWNIKLLEMAKTNVKKIIIYLNEERKKNSDGTMQQ